MIVSTSFGQDLTGEVWPAKKLFEDECTQSHMCAGRVMGVLSHFRKKAVKPPDYDPRNIVDLVDKYRDAHISDSGWREVDPEEWFLDN